MITILNREIPNEIEELTIEQFETITDINNDTKLDPIDKHLKIFEFFGIKESEFYDIDITEFIEIVKNFNTSPKKEYPTIEEIEIDGYTYKGQMKLTVRDTKIIEKLAIERPKGYVSEMLAVMFKRVDLSATEHYADAHIKQKAKLLKKENASLCIPYMLFIAHKIGQQANDADTSTVE